MRTEVIRADVPAKLAPLLQPARYKGAHGGRGGGKSHFFAEELILRCFERQTRAVCIREIQKSLRESVRQLLIDKIQKFGLGGYFEPYEAEIRGSNGSVIIFQGMQTHTAESIKSLEAFDIAWVEEAQTLSETSLRLLRPTVRKPGSELWFSWNPRHDTDAVDSLLRGAGKPSTAVVVEINAKDNPLLPDILAEEMAHDYATDPEMAEHTWGGGYLIVSEGSYYARAIAEAERDGRVGDWPHNPHLKVRTSWDIGVDDYTAVWFWQDDGFTATAIDYYEASGEGADEIIRNCMPEYLQDEFERQTGLERLKRTQPFEYGAHHLPHDVRVREWGSGARTRRQILMDLGLENVRIGARQGPEERINASRALLPLCRFDGTNPRVQLGIKRLRRYRRKWNDTLQTYTAPEHDISSHGADAFGEFAINADLLTPSEKWTPPARRAETEIVVNDEGLLENRVDIAAWAEARRRKRMGEARR